MLSFLQPIMRLDEVYRNLLNEQLEYYDRMYTLSSGPENGWTIPLTDARRTFIANRFPILKPPFVEGIPRYHKDENWSWEEISSELDGWEKQEMESISELLSSYTKWTPYPHQHESLIEWQKGKHIVVATGTGSGKTECFLYPMLGQLVREAHRAKRRNRPMERGIKAIVLYPMNALVADQTVRIRDLFGQLEMANKLMHKGAGRYCQFGMYTGRSPAHGWYAEKSGAGNWVYKKNGPRSKVKNITKAYTELEEHHPDLWERLVAERRVPAKGGSWISSPDGHWDENEIIGHKSGTGNLFSAKDNWSLKQFAEGIQNLNQQVSHVGLPGDRELFARYEMHLGGLIQRGTNSSDPTESERRMFEQNTMHLGVPDILVTNYSMLEYTLLRPLEHVFWEDTKTWLYGDVLENEPPRKLLLVLDEAHLYQGSMGTEVSMLIQRLTSVLSDGDNTPEIQVIITSASLGESDHLKQKFVSELTGVDAEDVVVPTPARTDILSPQSWNDLSTFTECVSILESFKPDKRLIQHEEMQFYKSLNLAPELMSRLETAKNEGLNADELQELRFEIFEDHDLFKRTYTSLQNPNLISAELHHLRPNGEKSSPWNLEKLSTVVLGIKNPSAMSTLLDLIAMCRDENGTPLMPIRGHFFSRGLPRLSVCPRCSSIHKLETIRCDSEIQSGKCNSRTYELLYGRSTGVAFLNIWLKRLDGGDGIEGLRVGTEKQIAYSGPSEGDTGDKRVGLAAWRCTPEKEFTHVLDMDKGQIIPRGIFNIGNYDPLRYACLKISGFQGGRFDLNLLWKNKHGKQVNEFFDRVCPETKRDHTRRQARQVSNLETRGNEAFSSLIDGMLQYQDSVVGSEHLPNEGKKCLIFSDSRQQAANVAVELGQLSNHDETRRLLMKMLSEDWFRNLPDIHRTLSGMYPWFALYSASKGVNPFCGGEYAEDRSLFVSAGINAMSSLLASYCLSFSGHEIVFNQNRTALENLLNYSRPSNHNPFTLSNTEFKSRKSVVKKFLEDKNVFKQNYTAFERQIRDTINDWLKRLMGIMRRDDFEEAIRTISNEVDAIQWPELKTQLNQTFEMMKSKYESPTEHALFEGISQHIKDTVVNEWRLTPELLAEICSSVIDLVEEEKLISNGSFFHMWNRIQNASNLIPTHRKEYGRYCESWAQFVCKLINDSEYGIEEIGLGYVQIVQGHWEQLSNESRQELPAFRYLLPRIFSRSFKKTNVVGSSILSNAIFSKGRMPGFNPHSINKNSPYPGDPPGLTEGSELMSKLTELIHLQGEFSAFGVSLIIKEFEEKSFFTSSGGRWGLNADILEIIPAIKSDTRICAQCYRPRQTPDHDNTKCGACGENEFLNSNENDFSQRYEELRIRPWRKKVRNLLEEKEKLLIIRAQEHTAQIGDKLDDSDLYSPAELYELQFQDMPVPDSTSVLGERSSLPPIDVLSCTTTMEVGIDIGSLTCVALRSMPPHSANYQQRIGRAGRGSAEVSVALTWADNSAYAQQLFEEPQRLLIHPESPPTLYMDNERIKRRHFQASLLQLFMKRKQYIRDLLIFDGMQESDGSITPSMVESLGMVDSFFDQHSTSQYSMIEFRKWIHSEVSSSFLSRHFSSMKLENDLLDAWKNDFVKSLSNYQTEEI